jgi:hypothetical protein
MNDQSANVAEQSRELVELYGGLFPNLISPREERGELQKLILAGFSLPPDATAE